MQISIRGKNMTLTPALREYVEKKLTKFRRYVAEKEQVAVTLELEKDRHRVEVTIPLNGVLARGEEETGDMYASVDLVVEKLEKQLAKYKKRLERQARGRAHKGSELEHEQVPGEGEGDEELLEDEFVVVRTKRFPLKPMGVDEAIMQMNLLGHNFFVFRHADSLEVNVVYRRRDGRYGLLDPQA